LTLKRAASAIMAGSAPAICTDLGSISPSWSMRRDVLTLSQSLGLEAAISETAYPAPRRLQSWRKGRSVTPAIGATSVLLGRTYGPILKGRAPCAGDGAEAEAARVVFSVVAAGIVSGRTEVASMLVTTPNLEGRKAGSAILSGRRRRRQAGLSAP
jgi:hypothetical protein